MAQLVPTWHEDRVLPLIVADRAEALFLEHSWSRSCWAQAARCSSSSVGVTDLQSCMLRGPLPELRLPALQYLFLGKNHLSGGLDPLRECKALKILGLNDNMITGVLEPLRGCTAMQKLSCRSSLWQPASRWA